MGMDRCTILLTFNLYDIDSYLTSTCSHKSVRTPYPGTACNTINKVDSVTVA